MSMVQSVAMASDRVMAALIAGLEIEFGHGAAYGLAERFIAAEESDFIWDARNEERWLGRYETLDKSEFELDRVAIVGRLDGRWFVAVCIVDGDGMPHGLVGRRDFGDAESACVAFAEQR